ncbi:MAG: SH3 domain-containing protein [Pseudomonadota bacterium]
MKILAAAWMLVAVICAPVQAQEARGKVTNLPIPRYVSIKAQEANARRGPSLNHRIDWVFHHRGTPLRVTAEHGHWRRVEDVDGAGGWMHYALLSGARYVLIRDVRADLYQQPEEGARITAQAEAGVIARLGACTLRWCRITAGRHTGWARKARLWGVGQSELRE